MRSDGFVHHRVLQGADVFDFYFDRVAVVQWADTRGGPRQDDVTGHKGDILGNEGNNFGDFEDHLIRVARLNRFSVEATADIQALGIREILSQDNLRPDWAKSVQGLTAEPAGAIPILDVALADIIHARISKNMVHGLVRGYRFASVRNDYSQLRFIIGS